MGATPEVRDGDMLREGRLGAAIFSADGKRRRWLMRRLSDAPKRVGFVMLNPSTAGADESDPTITRCIGFAQREGAGSLEVANLSDWIETYSENLNLPHCQGLMTDASSGHYLRHVLGCDVVIAAWGAHRWARGKLSMTGIPVARLNGGSGYQLMCLGKTRAGAPKHPLYVKADQPLVPWP